MKFVKKCVKLIMGFLNAMQEDCVGAYAAQTAYFIMLSFFPFFILLITLVQYTSLTPEDIYRAAQMIFPPSMDSFVQGIINEVYSKTAVTVSLSAIMAAWSAGKGFMGLIQGMNMIYNVEERRNYILLRLQSGLWQFPASGSAGICSDSFLCDGNSSEAEGYGIHRDSGGILYAAVPFCAESESAADPPGAGRSFLRGLLVWILHRILHLRGAITGTCQYVRQPDDHCAGDAVAVFLYVYHIDWR